MNRLALPKARMTFAGPVRISSTLNGPPGFVLLGIAAASIALVLLQMIGFVGAPTALAIISLAHISAGLYIFRDAGGTHITPTGIYFLSVAVFVGMAGLYGARSNGSADTSFVLGVSEMIFLANLELCALLSRGRAVGSIDVLTKSMITLRVVRWSRYMGVAFLVAGFATQGLTASLGPLPRSLAFVGVAALMGGSAALFAGTRDFAARVVAVVTGFGALLLFLIFFFSGFGRLNVVGLVLVAVLFGNSFNGRRWHKRMLIVALVPALLLTSAVELWRSPSGAEFTLTTTIVEGAGLVSGTDPLLLFAELVQLDVESPGDGFPRRFGMTFVEAFAAPIPRDFWEEKPFGFGFLLTLRLRPILAPAGHSMTALAYGEWYVNFWWFGLLLMPLVLAPVLRGLDLWQIRTRARGLGSNSDFLSFLALAILAGGLPEYIWAGLFTFVARSGIRVAVVAVVCLAVCGWSSKRGKGVQAVRGLPPAASRSNRIDPKAAFPSRTVLPHE